jgi:hypothetical protein
MSVDTATSLTTKGERALAALDSAELPQPQHPLPSVLQRPATLQYDTTTFDLARAVAELLNAGAGLAAFVPASETWSMRARRALQLRVRAHGGLCDVYERFIKAVVAPELARHDPSAAKEPADGSTAVVRVLYQFPPTLRVHPAGSRQFRRAHRDAEYGHQPGEVNFWLPLTDATSGRATLWVEPEPGEMQPRRGAAPPPLHCRDEGGPGGSMGFTPLELAVGQFARFYGVERHHRAPPNTTSSSRVSIDFRCALASCYDESWALLGNKRERKTSHAMRVVEVLRPRL